MPETRQALIEKYVSVDALETLLGNLALGRIFDQYGLDVPEVMVHAEASPDGSLFSVLWPGDDDCKALEYQVTEARSVMLASQLLFTLAGASEQLLERASYFAELADRNMRGITAPEVGRG